MGPLLLLLPLSVAAGYLAGAVTARRTVRREIEEIKALIAGGSQRVSAPPPAAEPAPPKASPEPQAAPAPAASGEVSPEILMVISAAVAAFLGKKARVRSARLIRPVTSTSAWAQQGRVFVQAARNLPYRGR
jgi:methylmalonyl-CoA carboxyltransferase large subunit